MVETSKRLEGIGEYYFSQKLREIAQLNKEGKNIVNLGIGSPDLPPHPEVIQVLQEESGKPQVHAYQNYKGVQAFRKAIADWYHTWYRVVLDPEKEILPLIGSKEGIMHIAMTYINPGDEVLVPNPGYPTYRSASLLAGATIREYALKKENKWMPDFEALNQEDLSRVKIMWVNYPHMPTGKLPEKGLFDKLVQFARGKNILLVHDNPYSFILNKEPRSIFSTEGAMEVALELNSLSKAQNMAGWRVGMLIGSQKRIDEVLSFKSNMDSGMFLPVQLAAVKALGLPSSWYDSLNDTYTQRREKVFELLSLLDCAFEKDQAGMFVWAEIPAYKKDSREYSDQILAYCRVFITPGSIFGSEGDRFIRISLCSPVELLVESFLRVKNNLNHLALSHV